MPWLFAYKKARDFKTTSWKPQRTDFISYEQAIKNPLNFKIFSFLEDSIKTELFFANNKHKYNEWLIVRSWNAAIKNEKEE